MNRTQLLAYAAAHFGKSLMWQTSGLVFAFYLTEVVGLAPSHMGAALAASLLLNAGMDLGLGWLLRAHVRSVASASLVQAYGAILTTAAFVAFGAAALLSPAWRGPAAITALLVFRAGYALTDVPQNAILALATESDADRVRVSTVRYLSAGASLIVLCSWIAPWLSVNSPERRAYAFFQMSTGIACTALLAAVALFAVTRTMRAQSAHKFEKISFKALFAGDYRIAIFSILIYSSMFNIFSKLQIYYSSYSNRSDHSNFFTLCVAVGQVLSQIFWYSNREKFSIATSYSFSSIAVIVACGLFATAAYAGGLVVLPAAAVYGAASSGLLMSIWAWLAAGAAPFQDKTMLFGTFTFVSKISQSISISFLGYILSKIPYRDAGGESQIINMMSSAPALAALLCLILLSNFRPKSRAA